MPETRYYKVKQERTVNVTANSIADATKIAIVAFEDGQTNGGQVMDLRAKLVDVWGNTTSVIREESLEVRRYT